MRKLFVNGLYTFREVYICKSADKKYFAPFDGVGTNTSTKSSLQYLGPKTNISLFRCYTIFLGRRVKSTLHYISNLKSTRKKYRLIWYIYTNNRGIFMSDWVYNVILRPVPWKYVVFIYFHKMAAWRFNLCNFRLMTYFAVLIKRIPNVKNPVSHLLGCRRVRSTTQ